MGILAQARARLALYRASALFSCVAFLVFPIGGQGPGQVGKSEGIVRAQQLMSEQRWAGARVAFDAAVEAFADCYDPNASKAMEGTLTCCLNLDDWDGARLRIRKFCDRDKAKSTDHDIWRRWNRHSDETRAARRSVEHFEFVRSLILRLSDYLAAHPDRDIKQRREELTSDRIDLNFMLVKIIAGSTFDLDSQGSRDMDWWWEDKDESPGTGEADDYWWGYGNQGIPLGPDGRPRFVPVPGQFQAQLKPAAKVLYLLKEIEALDTTPAREHAAQALLKHAVLASKIYGPWTDPGWSSAEFYYAYDSRPSFVKNYGRGVAKAFWNLGDNEARTLAAGKVQTIDLPESESPLAMLRLVETKFPRSAAVPEAIYLRGVYYQMRQQFGRALDEYGALQKAYPKHPRAALAGKKVAAILHPDVLLGRTGFYAAGTRPKLWFAHRKTERVEFTARSFDLPRYLDKEVTPSERHYLSYFGQNFLPSGGWGREDDMPKKLAAYLGKDIISWSAKVAKAERITTEATEAPLTSVGAFIVEARVPGREQPSRALVIVTDLVLVHKSAPKNSIVYAADAQSGRPVTGQRVRFYADQGRNWLETTETTNADGVIEASIKSDLYGVTALAVSAKGGLAVAQFDTRHSGDEEKPIEVGNAVTDRPVYRPGDTVHFRLWVRALANRAFQQPKKDQPVSVQVSDPTGNVIHTLALRTDSSGGVAGDYVLNPEAALGAYAIGITPKEAHYAESLASFRVEMYKKPDFEVKVEPGDKVVRPGASVRVRVSARYYFGGAVRGGHVRYQVFNENEALAMPRPQAFDWLYGPGYGPRGTNYPWLEEAGAADKNLDEVDDYGWYFGRERRESIFRGETLLRDDGTVDIDLPTEGVHDRRLTIEAEVRDSSRRTIRGKGTIVVARHDRVATLSLDRGWYRPSDRPRVEIGLDSTSGAGMAGSGTVRLSRIHYEGPNHKRMRQETVHEVKVATGLDGRFALELAPLAEGQYRAEFVSQDSKSEAVSAHSVFWVHGPRLRAAEFRHPDIEVIPDRGTYKVGDTAHLLIHVAQPNARIFWSDDARDGKLLSHRFLDVADHVAVIPVRIEQRHVPNFFVEATVVSAGQIHVEACEVLVPPVNDLLEVRVKSMKPVYRPGEDGLIQVAVTDAAGKPVSGPVTLTAYDKAVTYIQDETGIGPKSLLAKRLARHEPRYFGMATGWKLQAQGTFVCPEFEIYDNGHYIIGAMGGAPPNGGDPADATAKARGRVSRDPGVSRNSAINADPVIRRNFADTAVWRAALELGPDGTARTQVSWPESLTTWRLRAYALTGATQTGDATSEVTTTKNILVRLQTPRFLVEGDEVVLSANIHSAFPTDQNVRVELIVPAALIGSAKSAVADSAGNLHLTAERLVKAGGSERVDWPVRALQPGNAAITVKARGKDNSDAMQVTLPILAHGILREQAWAGAFRADENRSVMSFTVPEKPDPDQTAFELNMSPGPIGAMLDALPTLMGYPYGCTEQTMSRFYPTIVTANTLKKLGVNLEALAAQAPNAPKLADRFRLQSPVFDSAEMDRMADAGLNRLYNFQHRDSGWGWWPDDASSPYMTAYVLTGLQITGAAGKAVRPQVMHYAYQYLFQTLEPNHQRPENSPSLSGPETDAYIAHVLSWAVAHKDKPGGILEGHDIGAGKMRLEELRLRLYRERNRLNAYGQALLALALQQGDDKTRAKEVLRDLVKQTQRNSNEGTAHIPTAAAGWWLWHNSDIETNAWTLRAVLAIDPGNELAAGLARWLAQNRKNGTHWRSTRDSALAVAALAEYVLTQNAGGADCRVVVKLDGQPVREVTIGPKDPLAPDRRLVLDAAKLTPGNHTLNLERTGRGDLQFSARFRTFAKQATIQPVGKGLSLKREYFSLGTNGTKRALLAANAAIAVGDIIEVVLAIDAADDYDYLAFSDPKPAGCEPVHLQSGAQEGSWANVELRDQRVIFFLSYLSRGQRMLRYRLRAETPGAFRVLPTTGFAMYAPEIQGMSTGRRLVITDK